MQWIHEMSGFFVSSQVLGLTLSVLGIGALGYWGARLWIWTLVAAFLFFGWGVTGWPWIVFFIAAGVFNFPPLRALLCTNLVMKIMKRLGMLPTISQTERTALEAGVVWIEEDLFSGKPDFKKLLREPYPELTVEEKRFLEGPVEKLCSMINEWEIWKSRIIPKEIWDYMKKERFLGMIIPKEYGGLEFSALAHSHVIMKIASRSIPCTITVMVPNSLGPAELLIHFGTEAQKRHYLPRLARGEDVPCFALTEPRAGSDAGSIQAEGVLFKKDGKIYVRLNWNKRWITLAAVSTLLGLAFKLRDPDRLLGKGEDLGITCALIPSNTPGVVLGQRHDPLNVPFYNCPTQGKDVVVTAEDHIIGGLDMVGKGWKMLMESLGAGRGISLPAQATGGAKLVARITSAHAVIRKQFQLAIGKFEGVQQPLARIAAYTYIMEATRRLTLGALDQGIKPPVVTAIAKYQTTELGRKLVNDAMDVMGGAGISQGPRNLIAHFFIASPISITVEGANILTRTLMIFGQGALRAHPYAYDELKALEAGNLKGFDAAFWGHMGHIFRNLFRSVILAVTRGYLVIPPVGKGVGRYYQKLCWISASFAILADIAMGSLGGKLKQKEMITGRFADILSWMYMAFAVLRRYAAEGYRKEDLPMVHYCMRYSFNEIQSAFDGIFANLRVPGLAWLFNGALRVWSRMNSLDGEIRDFLVRKVAQTFTERQEFRERLTADIFVPKQAPDPLGRLESAYLIVRRSDDAERKIRLAIRKKLLPKKRVSLVIDEALKKNIITERDYEDLKASSDARWDAIQVDDFSQDEYLGKGKYTHDPLSQPYARQVEN